MKKRMKNLLILILTIQIVLSSTIFSGKAFAKTYPYTDPNTKLQYQYSDNGFLYLVGFKIDGKNASYKFIKQGDKYVFGMNGSGGYTVDIDGKDKSIDITTLLNALTQATGIAYTEADLTSIVWDKEAIENAFHPDKEPEEPEEQEEQPVQQGDYDPDEYAQYKLSGHVLTVTYVTDLNGTSIRTTSYEYNATYKRFEMKALTPEDIAYYNGFNNGRKIELTIDWDDLEELGIPEDQIPDEEEREEAPGGVGVPGGSDNLIDKAIDGVAGLILFPMKMVPLIIGKVLSWIGSMFADGTGGVTKTLTVSDILFNEIELTKIDFFNFNSSNDTVNKIRENVAIWYYGIRNIAAIILICVLIYVGIRMALSTIAEDKAKYKQMLIDWFVGLALLFVLHFIIIFIININNGLVNILKKPLTGDDGAIKDNIMDQLWNQGWSIGFTEGVGSAICYMLLVGVTFIFLLSYIKRMITLAFLIVIAPLVTVTYSIDKMGDGKSQALNSWLREFAYNILIQPFQCISYLALGTAGVNILNGGYSLSAVVVAIMIFIFILTSEKIIKEIFHFRASSMSDTLGSAVFAGAVLSKMKDAGKKKGGGGGGSSKYADPKSMLTPNSNAKNVKPGGDASRPALGNPNANGQSPASGNANAYSGTSTQTGRVSGSASSRKTSEPLQKRGAVQKAIGWYLGTSLKWGAALAGGALYTGATGDLKGILPVAEGAGRLMELAPTAASKRDRRKRLAKAYNDYADHLAKQDPTLTTDQINAMTRQRAVNLMQNNVSGPLNDYDKQLQESMKDINETYKNSGMGEEERNEQINEDFGDIETGKISEVHAPHRFRGPLKEVANNTKKWGFGGGTPTADQNLNGGSESAGGSSGPSANNTPNPNRNQENSNPNPQPSGNGKGRKGRRRRNNGGSGTPKGKNGYGNQQPPKGNNNPNQGNNPNNGGGGQQA